ncbi:hypothetical protein M407DRAFT_27736 [Tulasnella calospora MUT 4182]|uniref:Origin recognition complex subunit 1 n=1 Tax=Tulasnella calospora MUT 4182 TaxID=1051891 RepID=A0A0C3QC05_9AGAM|nr:hypothetical protein M407DRAFT_27736 [Tulasnella calospora MUT 4182]
MVSASRSFSGIWGALGSGVSLDFEREGHLKISAKEALKKLDRFLLVVALMDELDQLVTASRTLYGKPRYPPSLHGSIWWPTGVNSGGVMRMEHDDALAYYQAIRSVNAKSKGKGKTPTEEEFVVGEPDIVNGYFKDMHVAVITALLDVKEKESDQGSGEFAGQMALVHWSLRPNELPKTGAARAHREGEIYCTVDQAGVVPQDSILGHCDVLSPSEYDEIVGEGPRPRWTFMQQGLVEKVLCDTAFKDGLHFQLIWAKHAAAARTISLRAPNAWNLSLKGLKTGKKGREKEIKGPRKKVRRIAGEEKRKGKRRAGSPTFLSDNEQSGEGSSGSGSDAYEGGGSPSDESDEESVVEAACDEDTPRVDSENDEDVMDFFSSKKRKRTGSKALAARRNSMGGGRKKKIRVAAPSAVWHNETLERTRGRQRRMYISGVPRTGKTATVHAVVRELQKMAMNNETNPFTYVEINGLRLSDPSAAYGVLWEAVSGHEVEREGHLKISAKEALKKLDRYFAGARTGPSGGAL